MSVLATLGFVALVGAFGAIHLTQRIFRCPDCGHRHISGVTEGTPYCLYCGTQTNYLGRRWEAWKARLTGHSQRTPRKAGEER